WLKSSVHAAASVRRGSFEGSSCCSLARAWLVTLRPFTLAGRISIARTHRGSVSPVSTTGLYHWSSATVGTVQSGDLMIKSGGPYRLAKFHLDSSGHCLGGGISFASPFGAPESTHRTI